MEGCEMLQPKGRDEGYPGRWGWLMQVWMVSIFIFSSNCCVLRVEDKPWFEPWVIWRADHGRYPAKEAEICCTPSSFTFSAQPPRNQDAFQCIIQSNLKWPKRWTSTSPGSLLGCFLLWPNSYFPILYFSSLLPFAWLRANVLHH